MPGRAHLDPDHLARQVAFGQHQLLAGIHRCISGGHLLADEEPFCGMGIGDVVPPLNQDVVRKTVETLVVQRILIEDLADGMEQLLHTSVIPYIVVAEHAVHFSPPFLMTRTTDCDDM